MFQPDSAKPLGGRYQVIQLLGMGGFGQTFLAQDLHLPGHPRCVVKLVTLLDYMVQYDFRSRYATAAEALAALQETFPHPPPSLAPEIQSDADYGPFEQTPYASPSGAVQTVAVGRRPQPSPGSTATPQSGPGRSRQRERQRGNPFLPLGLGLVALLGLGALVWRTFLYSPAIENASQDTDAPAAVTLESNSSSID